MLKLIKNLFFPTSGKRTVVILNDDGSKAETSHRFRPAGLWFLTIVIIGGTIVLVIFLVMFTSLGGFVYNQQKVRNEVIAIQQQVAALQDSIQARNMQLRNLRSVIFTGEDTVLSAVSPQNDPVPVTNTTPEETIPPEANEKRPTPETYEAQPPSEEYVMRPESLPAWQPISGFQLPENAILISNLLEKAPDFPAPWPVNGTLTREFNGTNNHFGIDIAAEKGAPFTAIADGVVIGKNWSLNYGFVLFVEHANSVIVVYKHASQINKQTGEFVLKGDILGRVGSTGILSSGPHLHIEIWKNGIPQNPLHYLVNS